MTVAYTFTRTGKNGVRYTGMYRDVRGKLCSAGTFATEREAQRAADRAADGIAAGRVGDRRRGRMLLRQYVEEMWFPHHVLEDTTREGYRYLLDRYILPELGSIRMTDLMPDIVREWITTLGSKTYRATPSTIRYSKVILDAILTTAFNDQVTFIHAGKGVKTPPVPKKALRIITSDDFDQLHTALPAPLWQLLVETDIETGLRWGELTELRPRDLNRKTGLLTVARAVVELKSAARPDGVRFKVKEYPKDGEWRQVMVARHLATKIWLHIDENNIGSDDLIFEMPTLDQPRRQTLPDELPDPAALGLTEPNALGRRYRHGTTSAYNAGRCRCRYCRNAIAFYREQRRNAGKDSPRKRRTVDTDGHIPNGWFRRNIWKPALDVVAFDFHVTPKGLRHAHASWLLAGGANLQVVKERLGHGSIATTERYLHTLPNAHDEALAALTAIRGERDGNTAERPVPPTDATAADELTELRQLVKSLSAVAASMASSSKAG